MDVEDTAPRTGRPIVVETDKIGEIIQVDWHVSIQSIGQELGNEKKLDVWMPHEFTEKNLLDRIRPIFEADEKRITYENLKRKKSCSKRGEPAQTIVKPGLTARKVLLCVWWNWKGVIHYELLNYGQTLNSVLYCEQLDRLKQAINQKRPELVNRNGVVFHQDNARPQ